MNEIGQARRGRLKIFLGAAPGVGKTHAMLRAAQSFRHEGMDVVVGLIETHGRLDLEKLLDEIEQIGPMHIPYKGSSFEEIDVAAIVKRHPELVLVDELAHSNVPGSRNPKRYLDVEELLADGIDVWTTLNVQHVESLRETATKITWVELSETVPDSVLELADEIEIVDFSPAAVLHRFEEGRLDSSQHSRLGRSFFTTHNLAALRELALPLAKRPPARRVLVPFDGSPAALRAVQYVVSLARAGHRGSILLLNVQASNSSEAAAKAVLERAGHLLAAHKIPYVFRVATGKPAEAIIEAARRYHADLIVMGTTGVSGLASIFLGSVAKRVAEQSPVPVTLVR